MNFTRLARLDNVHLKHVPHLLFGSDLAPDDMRGATGDALLKDVQGILASRMANVLRNLLTPALTHIATVPLNAHERVACIMPSTPAGGGHAVAVMAFAPLPRDTREAWMARPNLCRLVLTSFPGEGAAYSSKEGRHTAVRGVGGLPGNVPRPLPTSVVEANARLFGDNAPMQGLHLMGGNSWCTAKTHILHREPDIKFQTVPWVTSRVHSQDGVVLWNIVEHPAYPHGLVWLSFHYGDHQVPTGDTVNAWLAPFLFHATFQRAMRIATGFVELFEKHGDRTSALMLAPSFAKQVLASERAEEPELARQLRLLKLLDRTGGLLMTDARYLMRPREPAKADLGL